MPEHSSGFSRFLRKILSLKTIVVLLLLASGLIPLFVMRSVVLNSYLHKTMESRMIYVEGECSILASDIIQHDYFNNRGSEIIEAELEEIAYMYGCRIMILDGSLMVIEDTYLFQEGKTLVSERSLAALNGTTDAIYDENSGYAKVYKPIVTPANKVVGVILVTLPDSTVLTVRNTMELYMNVIIIASGIIILLAGMWIVTLLVKPLNRLNRNITAISEGDKKISIEGRRLHEYNEVADSVNGMLKRLQVLDKSRDEFVSNVSHELKTPMTSMKVLAESLVGQENVPEEIYQEFMQDIVKEIDRENQIITDLLDLVKMEQTTADLHITTVNVNELIELVLKRLRPIAQVHNIELVAESFRPVAAEIDEVKFTLAVTNLVENAIKYNNDGGFVRVSVNADHKFFYVSVADSGIGIPQELKEQVFERFYRVDKARSRATGGTGLGLAITKNVIMMHKGTIKLYSKENEGTTFTVRVPLNYVN